jgi:Flp pilus assembly protein TadG
MRAVLLKQSRAGGSIVEFALILPILFFLIVNVVNFAGFFYTFITVAGAGRAAGDYMILGGASANAPAPPSAQQVANVLAVDAASLPSIASLQVRTCTRAPSNSALSSAVNCNICTAGGGSLTCKPGSGPFTSNPKPDSSTGEGGQYAMAWVDVAYTYKPFLPVFGFTALGAGNPLSTTVIHRQAVMRMMQ